ncbi:unnamed protein product [Prunus armeniaca]|uniref:Uncharacterized protein n=1 Tax=Prunus armeniaca TaxID=36596 RepID=A0A6J5VT16_PRUAR|nr:unnamed protein product [Prunus armeniaca]
MVVQSRGVSEIAQYWGYRGGGGIFAYRASELPKRVAPASLPTIAMSPKTRSPQGRGASKSRSEGRVTKASGATDQSPI